MLVKNAIDFIIDSPPFQKKVTDLGLNVNACRMLEIRLLADNQTSIYYFEVYFDFGNAGPSTHDINARIKINSDGSFSFLHFQ